MQLYFSGESFRNVKQFLRLRSVNISHVSVYKWIKKYVQLMGTYLEKLKPQVGNAWRTDELFVKIGGNMKYLYAVLDDEMKYLYAVLDSSTSMLYQIHSRSRCETTSEKRKKSLVSDLMC
jgi:transposase-like protein